MKKFVVLLAFLVSYSYGLSYEVLVQEQWENFKLAHGKVYSTEDEEQYRLQVFMGNLHKITSHNKLFEMGLSSYEMKLNDFGDLTEDEFLRFYTVNLSQNSTDLHTWAGDAEDFVIYAPPSDVDDKDLADEMDWRRKGYVTPVKNQGNCGSCWSFSATGALEGQWFRKHSKLVSLSEQNLVDCSAPQGNHGCNGGWMPSAFRYIIGNRGVDTESSYPYEARVSQCRFSSSNVGATVSSVAYVAQGEKNLKAKVSSEGPIAIAMMVINSFQFYGGGVYDDPNCKRSLNHAMLAVGYGTEKGKDYWLVKNSWGTGWGEAGYIKMARNKGNQCGIATAASYPII